MVTTLSIWLSITLQSSTEDYLLPFLFLVVAAIFFAIFYYWWRGVSDEDLEEQIEYETNQTTGPAMSGTAMPVYAQAKEDAIADLEILLAEEAQASEPETAEEV